MVEEAKARGIDVINTTCPYVRRAQTAARKLARAGFLVIIFGDESHREVQGILGYAGEGGMASLKVPRMKKTTTRVGIISQTTQNFTSFARFVSSFARLNLGHISELRVINTVCDATRKRQQAALALAKRVDLMFVIGSRGSANTRRLAEICSAIVETYHIEQAGDIDLFWLRQRRPQRVGITAGASTPDETIEEVIRLLESMQR